MFESTQLRRNRLKIEASISLANGDSVEGFLFVGQKERVTDLLNDERAFIPVEKGDDLVVIAKNQIAEVRVLKAADEVDDTDPYALLRVEPTASNAEVRAAWMARVKSSHPDRLASLNLDPEIIQAARRASQRINAAYDKIIRERKSEQSSAA